jgi:hypothetical protein
MKKRALLLLILVSLSSQLFAQQLYMPRNVKAAYAAGMRSMDGKPGARYFQNKSTHNIRISVTPPSRRVTGSQDIIYKNNSPIPLSAVVLRFELNVHAPAAMRERPVEQKELSTNVRVTEYAEDGKVRPWLPLLDEDGSTVNAVRLSKPLAPGGTVTLSFKWNYDLVEKSGREGAIDATTFYLAYFYPRIAVLDDIEEWDQTPHMLGHEFFGEFNDYNVEITVPKNYLVWGTGDLINIDQVLQPTFAERLKKSFTSDDVINISNVEDLRSGKVTAQTETTTWKWKADHVTDVAFALSDHYIWDAGSSVVDSKTGRRVSAQAAYDAPSRNFANMVKYIKSSLDFGSNDWPGVPYPYTKMTVVRGFADMEYPMMANDSAQDDPDMQHFIAAHEILHTYFPFYMGINERRYSFMEEGWTTAFEYLFNSKRFPTKADALFQNFRVRGWIANAASDSDIPIITPEDALSATSSGYSNNKYGRSALGYLALKDLLGDAEFKKALHEFMNRWNGKHPTPWDMFNSFNSASGKDLNWFFNAWFFSWGYIDHAITAVNTSTSGSTVTIKNIGGFPAPVNVVVTYVDGTTETLHQTPGIWQANINEAVVKLSSAKSVKSVTLNGGIFMDANPRDNRWDAK